MKEHQLYRFLESGEAELPGDHAVLTQYPQTCQPRYLRPVPSGWRRWDQVKPTEADGEKVMFVWVDGPTGEQVSMVAHWSESVWGKFCTEIHWHPLPRLPELKKPEPEPLDERARFELAMEGLGLDIERFPSGIYRYVGMEAAWHAWQAATAQKEVSV